MIWYLRALKKYFIFKGRSSRLEYAMFSVFNMIFLVFTVLLDFIFGRLFPGHNFWLLTLIYLALTIIPIASSSIRRLHDVGVSGWKMLYLLIPVLGLIWIIDLLFSEGEPFRNPFGLETKEE